MNGVDIAKQCTLKARTVYNAIRKFNGSWSVFGTARTLTVYKTLELVSCICLAVKVGLGSTFLGREARRRGVKMVRVPTPWM